MKKISALLAGIMLVTMSGNLVAQAPGAPQAGRSGALSDRALIAGAGIIIGIAAIIILWHDHHGENGHSHS